MDSSSIVAYTFHADIYCPHCAVARMVLDGHASPAALDMNEEDAIRQCVEANGFDYDDMRSYDSDQFPKPIFEDQIETKEHCCGCQEPIA